MPAQHTLPTADLLIQRYERIIQISQHLTSTLDTQTLLRRIVHAAAEVTDSEAASILLLDTASGELRFEMASNMQTQDFERFIVPLDNSLAGWVVTHGEPLVVDDVRNEPRFFREVDEETEFKTHNLLALPLRSHRGAVIGCLEVLNKRDGKRYEDDDLKLLSMLSLHAAIAIENSRLFLQSDFIAEAMHELRNPLASLRTSAALLKRPNLPDEKRIEIIDMLDSEIQRLTQLASEYLDLARLESGRTQLSISDVMLDKLIGECIDVVKSHASERDIRIHWLPEKFVVRADRGKVKQVLLNLLSNAVKYNRTGGEIHVRTILSMNDDKAFVQISVADTGYGISKENQRNMFQKFYRSPDTSGFTQGTGLGLAIARHIVEAHGGSIWLESDAGVGSLFAFTLPPGSDSSPASS
jgi:signal transduction histidine kinase